ncbi:MAG TPA: Spy/CpxP family protein refolding chaperone [Ignavibacteriaceae bacterium]|nr:Spy/CpxP family protein refolding chaperone [Ignavibacteriaceae bacterium]
MERKHFFTIIVLSILLTGSSFAQGFLGKGKGRGYGQKAVAAELNLSDDQKSKLGTLRTEHQKKMVDLRADMEKIHIEKRELINSDNFDASKIRSIEEKLLVSLNNIHKARINHQEDVLNVLNKEQQKIWLDRKPFAKNEFKGKRKKGGRDCILK